MDLALWKVQPNAKPKWWPAPQKSTSNLDTVAPRVWQQLKELWDDQKNTFGDYVLGQASGCVAVGDSVYDLKIQGCFQKCTGPTKPDLRDIIDWHDRRRHLSYVPENTRFEGMIPREDVNLFGKVFSDWMILPATAQMWPRIPPRWQFWRMERGVWFPLPLMFTDDLVFRCTEGSIDVFEKGQIVSQWRDWVSNLREKTTANLPPPTGQYLLIRRDVVESFTKEADCTFCWICSLTHFYREYSYGEYNTFAEYHEYGASSIISPGGA